MNISKLIKCLLLDFHSRRLVDRVPGYVLIIHRLVLYLTDVLFVGVFTPLTHQGVPGTSSPRREPNYKTSPGELYNI